MDHVGGHHRAAAPRRHRHHLERHRRVDLAPRRHAGDRERLVAEPELLPTAMEELLRAYAPVTMARLVKEDMDFNGCPMKADDWVLLPFPAANRDPEVFDRRRRGDHRPRGQPPRRLRPRHPPLRRLAPRPHGAARRARGVARALPGRSTSPTPTPSGGRAVRCAAHASSRSGSAEHRRVCRSPPSRSASAPYLSTSGTERGESDATRTQVDRGGRGWCAGRLAEHRGGGRCPRR